MKQNRIGLYQTGILTFFLTRCFFLVGLVPFLFQTSGIDSLISIIGGTLLGLGIVFFYSKLMQKMKNQSLFQVILQRFPKPFAYLLFFLLLSGLLLWGGFLLSQIALYINNSYLMDLTISIIVLTFLAICYCMAKGGLETIARCAEIIFFLFAILFLLSLVGIAPLLEPTRLKPFFSQEWFKIGSSSFLYGLATSMPLFFLSLIPFSSIKTTKKVPKTIFIGYLVASFTIFLTFLIMIGTLGIDLASYYQYPETAILKKVSYFHFIERVEGVLALTWLFDGVMVLSCFLWALNQAIQTFVPIKKNQFIYGFCLLILFFLGIRLDLSLEDVLIPLSLIFVFIPLLVFLQLYFTKEKKT